MIAYLTPDALSGTVACRRLSIPVELLHLVSGAIEVLTRAESYEQHGTMTPQETADAMMQVFSTYQQSQGECVLSVGMVIFSAASVAPSGTLLCDGATYQRVDYPELYSALDATFIVDADNFQVPDLDRVFIMGDIANAGETGGADSVTLDVSQMPAHTHTDNTVEPIASAVLGTLAGIANEAPAVVLTGSTGGGQAHENRPPYLTLYPLIIAR